MSIAHVLGLSLTLLHYSHCAENEATSGMTIFIRDTGDKVAAVELPVDATTRDLYIASGVEPPDKLVFSGTEIQNNDDLMSDIGICPESVITIKPPELWGIALFHFVRDLQNREAIPWFADALKCYNHSNTSLCDEEAVTRWWGIRKYHSSIERLFGPSMYTITLSHLELQGTLHWDALPAEFETVLLNNNHFRSINLYEVQQTSVRCLDLDSNQITTVDLKGLSGSVLRRLRLRDNHIINISFEGLQSSNLEALYLANNVLFHIDLEPLAGSKMLDLVLDSNYINHIGWTGLRDSNLMTLSVWNNQINTVDMEAVTASHLRFLDVGRNQIDSINLSLLFGRTSLQFLNIVENPIDENGIGVSVQELVTRQPITRLCLPFLCLEAVPYKMR